MAAIKQFSFLFSIVLVLFATAAASAQGPVRRGPGKGQGSRLMKRTETRTPLPHPPPVGTVNIRVVWNEIFGLPPAHTGGTYPSPCGLFVVSIYNVREKVRRPWLSPINKRRLQNFTANRRGVVSLWLFLILFALSMVSEFIANDRPLIASYKGEILFPVVVSYPETKFGGFWDSVIDRFSDISLFIGLIYLYSQMGRTDHVIAHAQ